MPSTSSLGIIVSASVYLLLVRLHRILPAANSFCIGLPCFAGIPLNAASTSKVKSSVSTIGLRDLLQVAFYSHFALVVLFVLAAAAIVVATALLALLRPVQHGIVELVASLTAITWCIYGLWLVCSRDSRFRAYSVLFVGFVIGMISGVLQARRLRDVVEVALDFITSVGFRTSLETSYELACMTMTDGLECQVHLLRLLLWQMGLSLLGLDSPPSLRDRPSTSRLVSVSFGALSPFFLASCTRCWCGT
eukprot:TRINITY_DN158_c0_g1_i19.p1 TRINITY_DN158_c0_g1~~TRINITY_DN158_c0_g1_i19.p1  ORF type:complete len:249 (-),score=36.44 TRINITY_DN158_c0_g1_i19:2856-3602(-)